MQPQFSLIILAGGQGERLGADVPKAFVKIDGKPLICHALDKFAHIPEIFETIVVVPSSHAELAQVSLQKHKVKLVGGGDSRQESVQAGLEVAQAPFVIIHEAARPLVSTAVIERVMNAARSHPAVISAAPLVDTIKEVADSKVVATVDRDKLVASQTPQVFATDLLRQAFTKAIGDFTDDASLIEALGETVEVVEGDRYNFKITTPADLKLAELILSKE